MMRLVLFLFLLAAASLGIAAVLTAVGFVKSVGGGSHGTAEGSAGMPVAVRTIAYILLLVLMLGVVTGALGAG